jgi:hypothetical protein
MRKRNGDHGWVAESGTTCVHSTARSELAALIDAGFATVSSRCGYIVACHERGIISPPVALALARRELAPRERR